VASTNHLREMCIQDTPSNAAEATGLIVEHALHAIPCNCVFVPTNTGKTARMISRFKPLARIVALSHDETVCQGLMFSYGVNPVHLESEPVNWSDFARSWLSGYKEPGNIAMLVGGPTQINPNANHRIEFLRIALQGD
jgi:pyruvate kinase